MGEYDGDVVPKPLPRALRFLDFPLSLLLCDSGAQKIKTAAKRTGKSRNLGVLVVCGFKSRMFPFSLSFLSYSLHFNV